MKTIGFLFSAAMLITATPSLAQSNNNTDEVVKIERHASRAYRQGEVLVKFKGEISVNAKSRTTNVSGVNNVFNKIGVTEVEALMPLSGDKVANTKMRSYAGQPVADTDMSTLYRLRYDESLVKSVDEAIESIKGLDEVEFAEPNYLVYTLSDDDGTSVTDCDNYKNEPLYNEQWGHDKIKLTFLWKQPKISNKRPVIAILDTGIDITHPDLVDNIWTNTLEADGEEDADDDSNGFADDLHGWDFVNQSPRIGDWNGHGTHCAGIAAAVGNNKIGITGANPDALIMPVTVMQSDGTGDVATIIKGIDYAVANGANVISMSFGGYAYSLAEEQALAKAYSKAVLVAAAGNDCLPINPDVTCEVCKQKGAPMFPAAFTFVLGVEASQTKGGRSIFSNYDNDGPTFSAFGEEKLYNYELRAPGSGIMSTYPGGRYKALNGTSMACPFVAGGISRLLQVKDYSSWEVLFADLIHARKNNNLEDVDFETAYKITDADRIPELSMVAYTLNDSEGGDNDQRPDAGETIAFYPTLRNEWGQAKNIRFSLELAEAEDPTIVEILDSEVDFGKELSSYGKNVSAAPIRFKVNPECADGRKICMVFRATCDNATEELVQEITLTAENGVEIGGIITENTTLYPGVQYIVTKQIAVLDNVTLTIKPGTVLRFNGVGIMSATNGRIICQGKPDSLIVLTGISSASIKMPNDTLKYVLFENLKSSDFSLDGIGIVCKRVEDCIIRDCDVSQLSEQVIPQGLFRTCIYESGYKNYGLVEHETMKYSNIVNNYGRIYSSGNVDDVNFYAFEVFLYDTDRSTNDFVLMGNSVFNNTAGDYLKNFNAHSSQLRKMELPIYLGTAREDFARIGIKDMFSPVSSGYGYYDFSSALIRPSAEAHALVWKVVVNGYDAQDEFEMLPPLGVGRHKFEVYFNRPMDKSFIPTIAMGVRPPYTSHTIAEDGTWNEDGTIYTAYLTITGKTMADGLNRIYVADAVESHEDFYIRKELQQLSQKTSLLLHDVANVSGKVKFQTSDASKEGYLNSTSNHKCSNLFDGSLSSGVSFDDKGYLQVDLGGDNKARFIRFNFNRNDNTYAIPDSIIVKGSNDGVTFEDIKTFSNLDVANNLPIETKLNSSWKSSLIDADISYRYYRFVFSSLGLNTYSSISEFGMEVLDPMVKEDCKTLLSENEASGIQKNIEYINDLCRFENRDNALLQSSLDQIYEDYNKLAAVLGQSSIGQVPVEVLSAPEWVIPIENTRFNVQVAAAGSMATGLMAEAGLGKVSLTWETDEEDFEDLLGYNIYRYTMDENGANSDSIIVNSNVIDSEETSFVDYDVVPGTTYYYVIKQLTTSLNSHALSNAVAATPLTAQRGDANGSMNVDVADVVTEIAYMTNQDPQPFIFEAADVNSDLTVNILDVVGTLNIITAPEGAGVATANNTAVYSIENGVLYVESPVALGGVQVRISAPEGTAFRTLEGLDGFEQASAWMNNNEYLFIAYSMAGRTIPAGKQPLLEIGDAVLSQIVFSDARGRNILPINSDATGIGSVTSMQMNLPYPNPFSTQLTIPYVIGEDGNHNVQIVVSDLAGRTVHNYGTTQTFGEYTHTWTPSGAMADGLYIVSLYVDGDLMQAAKVIYKK